MCVCGGGGCCLDAHGVGLHPAAVEAVDGGDDGDHDAGDGGEAPAAVEHVGGDAADAHQRLDREAKHPAAAGFGQRGAAEGSGEGSGGGSGGGKGKGSGAARRGRGKESGADGLRGAPGEVVCHLGAVGGEPGRYFAGGGGVEEGDVLVEDAPEQVDAQAPDDALLRVAEEEDAPEVEEGVDAARDDEEDDVGLHRLRVLVEEGADYFADKVGEGEGEGEANEKGAAASEQPDPLLLGQTEEL